MRKFPKFWEMAEFLVNDTKSTFYLLEWKSSFEFLFWIQLKISRLDCRLRILSLKFNPFFSIFPITIDVGWSPGDDEDDGWSQKSTQQEMTKLSSATRITQE